MQWRGVCAEKIVYTGFSGRLQRCETGGSLQFWFCTQSSNAHERTRDSSAAAYLLTFWHAVFLRKLHTYAVNVSTGSEEDPGRTRSAGYQVVCIACTFIPKWASADGLICLPEKVVILSQSCWFESKWTERRWRIWGRGSCTWWWTCCAF